MADLVGVGGENNIVLCIDNIICFAFVGNVFAAVLYETDGDINGQHAHDIFGTGKNIDRQVNGKDILRIALLSRVISGEMVIGMHDMDRLHIDLIRAAGRQEHFAGIVNRFDKSL